MVPSGYGTQTRQLIPRLRDLGHDVAVSAFYGVSGAPITWNGVPIFPAGAADFGVDVLPAHAQNFGADLVLTLMDFFKLAPAAEQLADLKVAAWLPNDCEPLGKPDEIVLKRSRAFPIAMSRWGRKNLVQAGFGDAAYVPHAIDTKVFAPPEDRDALRRELGIHDRFVIGLCAANRDAIRKAFPEQLQAFARFRAKHPEAVLMLHSIAQGPGGYDLVQMAEDMGISDAVILSDQYAQVAGLMPDEAMAGWYGALDVLTNCSYGEGFGLAVLEAQACGTPVIVTNASAMVELCGAGYMVRGQEFWNAVHRAWWVRPNISDILSAYEKAWRAPNLDKRYRQEARDFALTYDADRVVQEYWQPLLKELEES